MIRINLMGVPKPKKGRRAAAAAAPEFGVAEGPNKLVLVVVGLVLAAGPNLGAWWYLDRQASDITEKTAVAQRELDTLRLVKKQVEDRQRLVDSYRTRVKVIDQLRSNQAGPVNLLTTIGETVNKTDAVWLGSMKDEGSTIAVEGVALSHSAVANLITNLKRTGYFENVELRETVQDEKAKEVDLFNFTVACEKKRAGA
ncbi:MAG: PilN domain-containing protein [Acidobacteria bacterium]|nr:PilN domain-containing protein [Acidobacteriota bacterium]